MLFASSRLATALSGAACLFLSFGTEVTASGLQANLRRPASVSYRGRGNCPELCSVSGPNPANWTGYHDVKQLAACKETIFYHMGIYDMLDDTSKPHGITACTSNGNTKQVGVDTPADATAVQTVNNASFTLGRWDENAPQGVDLRALSKQMRKFLGNGYTAPDNRPLIMFAQTVSSTAGLYMGKGVQIQSTAGDALLAMENTLYASNNTGGSVALQLCEPGYTSDHVFGFIATSNTSFTPVQQALQSWVNATCLTFNSTQKITSTASFTTPLILASSNGTIITNATTTSNGTFSGSKVRRTIRGSSSLNRRADCTTIQVASGDSCGSLADKCGITAAEFTEYNPSSTLCSSLIPLEHVCCSAGDMPDFTPKPNADGSCATYTVQPDENCSGIGAANSLTNDQIESFNTNTWAFSGCANLQKYAVICLSTGSPPMPATVVGYECGPQKPGTTEPSGGTSDIASLNPCPLNACCDIWGQCGITDEYCTDTGTGNPGTAAPNTNGCISNCGTDIVQSDAPSEFISLAYYEGYGMDRVCLYQDARQIDTSKFSHVHFAFGVLSADYEVTTGSDLSTYEFNAFMRLENVHKVLSFGGWAFSTDPATYSIFRNGVTAANRLTMATNIANFIIANGLDGVDIDWEYPGEPDIPGIPAGGDSDGTNYLAFLAVLKNLLPGKTVSIAAPASYWYLKQFPIAQISKVVDYIVFMTYDLHGQWDTGNQYSQEGCANGNCLRSHVNLTETRSALAMVTKAGVASNKLVVGVSSYGRSFAMADASCYTPDCLFTGSATASDATPGPCTATGGYISDAEIYDIINGNSNALSKRTVNQNYLDPVSNSRIVVYDDNQWVAFMDDDIRSERSSLYQGLSMAGTTNWASDLEKYNDAPSTDGSWSSFRSSIKLGVDPYAEGDRNGNWTDLDCSNQAVQDIKDLTPQQRWAMLDGADAWSDILNVWNQYDKGSGMSFTQSVSDTIHGPPSADCGTLLTTNNCEQTLQCSGFVGGGSGAVAYEIWNSMVYIHEMYASYITTLYQAAAASLDPALKDFETQFAPIPPPPNDEWLGILLSVVSLVGTVAVSAVFNSILKGLTFWETSLVSYDNSKDIGKALVSFSTSIAGTLTGTGKDGSGWTVEKQDAFSDYMGQAVNGWANITEMALKQLFDGSDTTLITGLIAGGQFIEGGVNGARRDPDITAGGTTQATLEAAIAKSMFAFAIPELWSLAGTRAFVLDSGYDCGTVDPEGDYLSTDTMHATAGCYDGKLYYLVNPDGDAQSCDGGDGTAATCTDNEFSVPPGISTLDGTRFGGVTVADLITGSLRTYVQNGNANGGAQTDPTNDGSIDDLINQDVTTPGFIRLPVCSPEMAFTAWSDTSISSDMANYPCVIKPSPSDCESSSFVDQTSDASPSVDDCMGIVNNIKGTQGEWEVENAIGTQHQIVQYGDCKFGIQGLNKKGNVDFNIGAQDIVDIITTSIEMFGGGGKVGAKGDMDCKGDVNSQDVEWGLY